MKNVSFAREWDMAGGGWSGSKKGVERRIGRVERRIGGDGRGRV